MIFENHPHVRFYRDPTDEEPVRQWLHALKKEDQIIIGTELMTLAHKSPLGMPLGQQLARTVRQIQCPLTGQNSTARVLFAVRQEDIVLLHGFVHDTDRRPDWHYQRAFDRLKSMEHG
jgi:phage-related protein